MILFQKPPLSWLLLLKAPLLFFLFFSLIFFFQQPEKVESTQEELYQFLKLNNSSINMLNNYTAIKKLFIKYNTGIPSSASVEYMFSIGGSIMTPQRGYLNDDIFEYQIL